MAATVVTFDGVKITLESVDSPAEVAEKVTPLNDLYVFGQRVTKIDVVDADGERPNAYNVFTLEDGSRICSCADSIVRGRYCKHLRRLW